MDKIEEIECNILKDMIARRDELNKGLPHWKMNWLTLIAQTPLHKKKCGMRWKKSVPIGMEENSGQVRLGKN